MSWLAFAFGYTGVALFAFAMAPHHRTVFGRVPAARRARGCRLGAVAFVALSLSVAVHASGWQVGAVAWGAMLMASGFMLTLLLAYSPRLVLAPTGGLLLWPLLAQAFG